MRFMVIVKSTPESENNAMPTEEELAAMTAYNEELVKAGVLLAGEGLLPSSEGARVVFEGDKRTVVDGPFTESKELVAGYWLIDVKDKNEAIEWVKRIPSGPTGEKSEVEIRRVAEAEDFGDALTPELREREQRLREQAEGTR
ncbi:MAG TPA: YciI family protein [Actinopolymorphaceae bacterium]